LADRTVAPPPEADRAPAGAAVITPPPHLVDMTDTPADPEKLPPPPASPDEALPETGRQEEGGEATPPPGSSESADPYVNPDLLTQPMGHAGLFPKARGGWLGLAAQVVVVAVLCYVPMIVHGVCLVSLLVALAILAVGLVVLRVRPATAITVWVVVAVASFGLLELWNGTAFNTLSLTGPPPAVQWCGAHYDKAGTGSRPPHLKTVGTAPSGMAILSAIGCDAGGPTPRRVYGDLSTDRVYVYVFHSLALATRPPG
jgi:hypothetical protein